MAGRRHRDAACFFSPAFWYSSSASKMVPAMVSVGAVSFSWVWMRPAGHGVAARQAQLAGQAGCRLAFGHTTQQQHQRGRVLPRLCEDGPRQQRIVAVAGPAPVGWKGVSGRRNRRRVPLHSAGMSSPGGGGNVPARGCRWYRPSVRQLESRSCSHHNTPRTIATHEPGWLANHMVAAMKEVFGDKTPITADMYVAETWKKEG